MTSLILALLGAVVNGYAYGSPAPMLVAPPIYVSARMLMAIVRMTGRWERFLLNRLFGVGLLASVQRSRDIFHDGHVQWPQHSPERASLHERGFIGH